MKSSRDIGSDPGKQRSSLPARKELFLLIVILLFGLGYRGAYLVELSGNPELKHPPVDEGFNLYWARGLATDDWSLPPDALGRDPKISERSYLRPPGYAFLLSAIYRLCGGDPLGMRAVQMFFGLLNLLLAYGLGRRLIGARGALLWAALIALSWPLLYFEGGLNASVFLITLSFLLCFVLRRLVVEARWQDAVSGAVLIALMALLRANIMLVAPFLLLWGVWVLKGRTAMNRLLSLAVAALVAGALTLAPTTIRNAAVEGAFVPISANGGLTLYHGNNEDSTGISTSQVGSLGLLTSPWAVPDIIGRVEKEEGRSLSFSEVSAILGRRALRWMRENPGRELRLIARRFILFWGPDPIAHNHVPAADRMESKVLRLMPISFSTAAGGALIGLLALISWWRRSIGPMEWTMPGSTECGLAILLMIAAWCLSFLPFFVTSLYRTPLIPFLLFGLAAALLEIGRSFKTGRPEAWKWATALATAILLAHVPIIRVPSGMARRCYDQGLAWSREGKPEAARRNFLQAVKLDPSNAAAHNALGKILLDTGDLEGAHREFSSSIGLRPQDPVARSNVALVEAIQEEWAEAERNYQLALSAAPAHADWWLTLGICREHLGRFRGAAAAYQEAIDLAEESGRAANNLAWLLATSPDVGLRDGSRALMLARELISRQENPGNLDTFAAALAETGDFEGAVKIENRALEMLGNSQPDLRAEIESRQELFSRHLPFRDGHETE